MEISINNISSVNSNITLNYENMDSVTKEKEKDVFDLFLEKLEIKKTEEKEQEALLENLDSVAKTGFTKDELELIKQIFEELQKRRAESTQTSKNPEDYIKDLQNDLQTAIFKATGKQVKLDKDFVNSFLNQQNNSTELLAKPTIDEELRLLYNLKKI